MVLLDIGLPVLDGWAVLDRTRELSDVPVLILTSHGLEAARCAGCARAPTTSSPGRSAMPDLIEATARYWSSLGPSRYAEAFEVVRDQAAGPAGQATVRSIADPAASAETAQILEVGHAS
ncbi:MAG TPA: hypothetical protein VK586_05895 [Streptosporangiaceae bacterium]|nr:hypothetical protein [Streptosporangiaceae bacterium]